MHHLPSQHVSQMLRRFTHYRRVISKASFTSVAPHRPRHPWFVDPADEPGPSSQSAHHLDKSHSASPVMQPLPISAPEPLKLLHAELSKLPQLELTKLVVRPPPQIPLGPMLPESIPKGKRRRGKTFSGFGIPNVAGGGTWNWVAMAQVNYCLCSTAWYNIITFLVEVKEGTENRGAIESVVRVVRRTVGIFRLFPDKWIGCLDFAAPRRPAATSLTSKHEEASP